MVLDANLLNIQHYKVRIKVKWSNPGKGVWPSSTPRCSSYRKGGLQVTLDERETTLLTYTIRQAGMKEKIRKVYHRRTRKLLETQLCCKNLMKTIIIRADLLLIYSRLFFKSTKKALRQMDHWTRKVMTMHKLTSLKDTRGRSWNWNGNEFNKWTRGQERWWRCTSWRPYKILGAILEIDVRMNSINWQEVKKRDDDAQADVLIRYSGPFLKLTCEWIQ